MRSLNLIPFIDASFGISGETISNFVVFIPLGLLLSVNLKQTSFWRKLSFVLISSVTAEAIQYMLAIGTSDITDVIMNTLGGSVGLALYGLGNKLIKDKTLDRIIVVTGIVLFVLLILLRIFVFKVRY